MVRADCRTSLSKRCREHLQVAIHAAREAHGRRPPQSERWLLLRLDAVWPLRASPRDSRQRAASELKRFPDEYSPPVSRLRACRRCEAVVAQLASDTRIRYSF